MQRARGEDHARLILRTIKEIRAEHHACTAREVARRIRISHNLCVRQLGQLRKLGLVTWTAMDGSLHLTGPGGKAALKKPAAVKVPD